MFKLGCIVFISFFYLFLFFRKKEKEKEEMAASSSEQPASECPVCVELYTDEGDHQPFCLPCGHNLCGQCLETIRGKPKKPCCPRCLKGFNPKQKFDKNRDLLSLLDFMEKTRERASPSALPLVKKRTEGGEEEASLMLRCGYCNQEEAEYSCVTCETHYCTGCWDIVHRIGSLKTHAKDSCVTKRFRACVNHPLKVATYMLVVDDNELQFICQRCSQTSDPRKIRSVKKTYRTLRSETHEQMEVVEQTYADYVKRTKKDKKFARTQLMGRAIEVDLFFKSMSDYIQTKAQQYVTNTVEANDRLKEHYSYLLESEKKSYQLLKIRMAAIQGLIDGIVDGKEDPYTFLETVHSLPEAPPFGASSQTKIDFGQDTIDSVIDDLHRHIESFMTPSPMSSGPLRKMKRERGFLQWAGGMFPIASGIYTCITQRIHDSRNISWIVCITYTVATRQSMALVSSSKSVPNARVTLHTIGVDDMKFNAFAAKETKRSSAGKVRTFVDIVPKSYTIVRAAPAVELEIAIRISYGEDSEIFVSPPTIV